jgi:hypothetical protein
MEDGVITAVTILCLGHCESASSKVSDVDYYVIIRSWCIYFRHRMMSEITIPEISVSTADFPSIRLLAWDEFMTICRLEGMRSRVAWYVLAKVSEECGGSRFRPNACNGLPDYTVSHTWGLYNLQVTGVCKRSSGVESKLHSKYSTLNNLDRCHTFMYYGAKLDRVIICTKRCCYLEEMFWQTFFSLPVCHCYPEIINVVYCIKNWVLPVSA